MQPVAANTAADVRNVSGNVKEMRLPHQMGDMQSLDGVPVRVGPVVQRVWIKRFVDGNDLITSNVVVYKEVIPNHWAGFKPNESQYGVAAGAFPHKAVETKLSAPVLNQDSKQEQNNNFNQPGSATTSPVSDGEMAPSSASNNELNSSSTMPK